MAMEATLRIPYARACTQVAQPPSWFWFGTCFVGFGQPLECEGAIASSNQLSNPEIG